MTYSTLKKLRFLHLLVSYSDILTDTPGRTISTQHIITVSDNTPVVTPRHPKPLHYEDDVMKELKELLDI